MIKFNELLEITNKNPNKNNNKNLPPEIPWIEKYRPSSLGGIVHQDDIIKMLHQVINTGNLPHLLLYGPSGCGKCLAPDTKIILYSGLIKLAKDIKPGDLLMGDDNTPRTVLSTCSGQDQLYQIINRNTREYYIVNSNHILSLKLSKTFFEKIIYQENQYTGEEIPVFILGWFENHKYFENKFDNQQEYSNFKNNLLANPNTNKQGDILDINILDYQKNKNIKNFYLGYRIPELTWPKKNIDGDPYQLGINLANLESENIPENYIQNDPKIRLLILAGFLDTRGYYNELDQYEFNLPQENTNLINNIIYLARTCGFLINSEKFRQKTIIFLSGELDKIPTKKKFLIKNNKIDYLYNIDIYTNIPNGQYCGFELSGNGRFLLGDLTVTHNTSTILAIGMELFGPKKFNDRVIELNASDERGINIVRNKIANIAKSSISSPDPKYPSPPYKIIILDEADAMTTEAQSALRKIIEDRSNITRFCFICNYINQIIEPITSRCVKFRFKPIASDAITNKLKNIAIRENLKIKSDSLNIIANFSNGDLRKAIMALQNLKYLNKEIDIADVNEIVNIVPLEIILEAYNIIKNKSKNIVDITNMAKYIKQTGYPINNIIIRLLDQIISDDELSERNKSIICYNISLTEKRVIDGADEYLQLLNIFFCIRSEILNLDSIYNNL